MIIYDIRPPRAKVAAEKQKKNVLPAKSRKILAVFTILFLVLQFFAGLEFLYPKQAKAAGTIYYVDSSITDTNPASATPDFTTYNPTTFSTSTGTDSVYKTIADVNLKSFSAGDSVLFRKGQTWREQLTVPSSGSAGSPITFGAFGSGEKPIIDGSDLGTSWTSEAVSGTNLTGDANLQAYYYLEEATNATRNDGTANVNHLTDGTSVAQSTNHVEGSYAAQFTSASSMVLNRTDASLSAGFIGKTGSSNTEITVGVWVYFNSTSGGIISKGSNPTTAVQFWFSSGYLRFGETLDGSFRSVSSNVNTYTSGVWYHIVGRVNSTTKLLELFINGVKQTASYTATSTTLNTNGSSFRVGYVGGVGYLDGLSDEVFVFNRALTDTEISNIYSYGLNGTRNSFTSYYKTGFSEPKQVFENGSRLIHSLSKASMPLGSWYWDTTNSRVYIRCSGDANPTAKTIEIGQRNYGIWVDAKNYINIQNFNVKKVNNSGIFFWNSSNNGNITNNDVSYAYESGINSGTSGGATVNNVLDISYNTVSYSGGNGISIYQTANSNTHHNSASNNSQLGESYEHGWSAGIRSGALTAINNIFENNVVYDNGLPFLTADGNKGVGIWLDGTGAGNIVRNNLVYGNHSHGIFNEISEGNTYYYNIIYYGNAGYTYQYQRGILIGRGSKNVTVFNNTIYGLFYLGLAAEGENPPQANNFTNNIFKNNIVIGATQNIFSAIYGGENDGTNGSGNVYTYNSFGPEASNFIQWGIGVYKSTYSTWETAYGGTTNSVTSDPLFTNAAGNDFTLQSTSPAINTGINLGSSYNDALMPGSSWPSSVTTVDQDLRGSGWEIGAYVYPVPQAPTIGTPSTLSISSIRWNFTDNSNDETGFRIYGNTNSVVSSQATANLSYLDETDLSCRTSYSGRYVKAYNSYGESASSANASSQSTNGCPGGGVPSEWWNPPKPPTGGFGVLINNGAESTSIPTVILNLKGGSDTANMAISNFSDFRDAGQENYTSSKVWNLCWKNSILQIPLTCPAGTYTVYVKFFAPWGTNSGVVSDTIVLKTGVVPSILIPPTQTGTNLSLPQGQSIAPFTKYLPFLQRDADVKRLQIFLNQYSDTRLANSGPGSSGKETNFFGQLTLKAVIKFQEKYTKDVLAPYNLTKGTGFVGRTTTAKINQLLGF